MEDTAHYYWVNALDLQVITDTCGQYGITLAYPEQLEGARLAYERLREWIFSLPGLRLLTQNSLVVWASAVLLCYALWRRRGETLLLMVPLVLQLLVIFVGPMDGTSFRYVYPLALYFPVVLLHAVFAGEGRAK